MARELICFNVSPKKLDRRRIIFVSEYPSEERPREVVGQKPTEDKPEKTIDHEEKEPA